MVNQSDAIQNLQYLESLKIFGVDQVLIPKLVSLPPNQSHPSNTKTDLSELCGQVSSCVKCHELASTRTKTVFGSGNLKSPLVFVGEAPGYDEDKQGLPFVGKAGQLLTKMIEAMGCKREEVYICNVLKCRPPQNRNPLPVEIENCVPYLWAQLEFIKPKIICALGTFAAQTLLKTPRSISSLRGAIHESGDFRIVCTYHPAYLLRNPADKKKAWEDLKRIMQELKSL